MEDAGHDGRTVLFVSHNLPAVTRLCSRAILLKNGELIMDDTANAVVGHYLSEERNLKSSKEWSDDTFGDRTAQLRKMRITDCSEKETGLVEIRDGVGLEMEFEVLEGGRKMLPSFDVYNEQGELIFVAVNTNESFASQTLTEGSYRSRALIPGDLLNEGFYNIGCHLSTTAPWHQHFNAQQQVSVQIVDNMKPGSARGVFMGKFPGAVRPKLNWNTTKIT